jgi:hypothetical protein
MRVTRRQDRVRPAEPSQCSCMHIADTPEWHGHRQSGAGLTGRRGAGHGNPFKRTGACIHSELQKTTAPRARTITVQRVRP